MSPSASRPLPAPPPVDRFGGVDPPRGPGGGPGTPWDVAPPAEASAASQIAAWVTCSAAMLLVGVLAGNAVLAAACSVVLGLSIVVGLLFESHRLFRSFAGFAAALIAMVAASFACGYAGLPPILILFVGLGVLGLDWTHVRRLRLPVWLAGLFVVFAASTERGWGLAAALGWLVLALATLWSLEEDQRAALDHPQPLDPRAPSSDARTMDLVTMLGVALAAGLLVAFLIGNPSCNLRVPKGQRDQPTSGPGQTGDPGNPGNRPGTQPNGPDSFRDPETGRRYPLSPGNPGSGSGSDSGGSTYQRSPNGDVIVRDPDGTIRVYGAPDGGGGRPDLRVTEPDGTEHTYRYDDSTGVPRVTEYDRTGRVVKRYRYDPNGTWVDESGSGTGNPSTSPPPDRSKPDRFRWPSAWWLLLPILIAAAVGAYLWNRSRRAEITGDLAWALRLVDEIETAGRERGRPRATSETIVGLTQALSTSVLPDPRLADVGRILSGALFDRADVDAYTRLWAQSTVTEILTAHPVPSRRHKSSASPTPN